MKNEGKIIFTVSSYVVGSEHVINRAFTEYDDAIKYVEKHYSDLIEDDELLDWEIMARYNNGKNLVVMIHAVELK